MSKARIDRRTPGSKPIYVNRTVMTKKTLKEMMNLNWRANAGWLRIVLLVLAGLALAFALLQVVLYGLGVLGQVFSIILLGGISLYLGLRGYMLRAWGYIRLQMQNWGGSSLEKTVSFYPEEIMQESPLGQLHFGYDEMRGVVTGKNLMIIKLADGGLVLNRFGFEGSSEDEVKAYLEELTPPPPPKKKLGERLAEARAEAAAAQVAKAGGKAAQQQEADPKIAALLAEEDEDEAEAQGGFDITDDSWVDEMDAEEAAGEK